MGVKIELQKKTGKIYIVVIHNRQRVRSYCGRGPEGQKIAEEAAPKIAASLVLHPEAGINQFTRKRDQAEKIITFKAYAEKQMKIISHTREINTICDYTAQLKNHINPEIGHYPLDEITRPIAKDFILSKLSSKKINAKEGDDSLLGRETVRHIFNTARMILNLAIEDQIIQVNPFHNMGKLIGKMKNHEDINFLTPQEIVFCLNSIKAHYPYYYPVFFTAVRTGLRIGELLTLKWEDIDFNSRSINVCRTSVRGGKVIKDNTKNGKKRRVDMSQELTELLLACKSDLDASLTRIEQPENDLGNLYIVHRQQPANPEDWIFTNAVGNRMDEAKLRKILKAALQKAGLSGMRVHDLRHTYASTLIGNGAPLAYVKEQMGHASIQITVDIYGHLVPGANRHEQDRIDALLSGQIQERPVDCNGTGTETGVPGTLERNYPLLSMSVPAFQPFQSNYIESQKNEKQGIPEKIGATCPKIDRGGPSGSNGGSHSEPVKSVPSGQLNNIVSQADQNATYAPPVETQRKAS